MKSESFFKGVRNKQAIEVSSKPAVLAILYRLAMFTPRNGTEDKKWILIKWRDIGLTEQPFRDAKDYIKRNGLGTFRRTNRGTEFKLTSKTIFDINNIHENEQRNDQGTDVYIQESNKKIKQEKEIYKEKNLEPITASTYQNNSEPLQSSAKVSPLLEQVIALGKRMGVKLEITTGFEHIESKFQQKTILDVAENLFAWVADNPKQKASTARLLNFLKSDQQKKLASAQPKEGSVLARWEKQSSVVQLPAMQKVEASTVVQKQIKLTPEQERLRALQKRIQQIGESKGIEMTFGFSSLTFAQISHLSDEIILEEAKAMLELEIRKYADMPASERKPLKNFSVGERQMLARVRIHTLKAMENVPF